MSCLTRPGSHLKNYVRFLGFSSLYESLYTLHESFPIMARKISRTERAQQAFDSKDVELSKKAHSKKQIELHIHEDERTATKAQYLGEFVYGALDGTVTTFAIVAGAAGATRAHVLTR